MRAGAIFGANPYSIYMNNRAFFLWVLIGSIFLPANLSYAQSESVGQVQIPSRAGIVAANARVSRSLSAVPTRSAQSVLQSSQANSVSVPCTPENQGIQMYNCQAINISSRDVMFYWETSKPSDSQVFVTKAGKNTIVAALGRLNKNVPVTTHILPIRGQLESNTEYEFWLSSLAPDGNQGQSNLIKFRTAGPTTPYGFSVSPRYDTANVFSGTVTLPLSTYFFGSSNDPLIPEAEVKVYAALPDSSLIQVQKVILYNQPRNVYKELSITLDTTKLPLVNGLNTLYFTGTINSPYADTWGISSLDVLNCLPNTACLSRSGVINPASFKSLAEIQNNKFVPGQNVSLYGSGFIGSGKSPAQCEAAATFPLPRNICGTRVNFTSRFGSFDAPLQMITNNQVNLQIPFEILPAFQTSTTAQLKLITSSSETAGIQMDIVRNFPEIYMSNPAEKTAWAYHSVGGKLELISKTSPARSGESVTVLISGGGWPTGNLASGMPADNSTSMNLVDSATLFFGNTPQFIIVKSTKAPGLVGVDALTFTLPAGTATGTYDISFQMGNNRGAWVKMPVVKPAPGTVLSTGFNFLCSSTPENIMGNCVELVPSRGINTRSCLSPECRSLPARPMTGRSVRF